MSKKTLNIAGTLGGGGTTHYLKQGLQAGDDAEQQEEVQLEEHQDTPHAESPAVQETHPPSPQHQSELQHKERVEEEDDDESEETHKGNAKKGKKNKKKTIADTIHFTPDIHKKLRKAWMQRKIKDPGAKKWHIVNEALELYFQQEHK